MDGTAGPSEEFLRRIGGVPPEAPDEPRVEGNPGEFIRRSDPRLQGIAADMGYAQDHARIQKVRYTHDAMIELIIEDPTVSQDKIAAYFGYSVPWVSRIFGSDAFQARLAQRKLELTDPFLVATIEERFRGLAMQSIDIIAEKLAATKNPDLALKALDISSKAMGFGARAREPAQIQNNFVVAMPAKAASAEEWAATYTKNVTPAKSNLSTTASHDPTEIVGNVKLADSEENL